jgi:hypothetical protein
MGAFRREQAECPTDRIAAVGTLLAPDGSLSTQDKTDLAVAVVSDPRRPRPAPPLIAGGHIQHPHADLLNRAVILVDMATQDRDPATWVRL